MEGGRDGRKKVSKRRKECLFWSLSASFASRHKHLRRTVE